MQIPSSKPRATTSDWIESRRPRRNQVDPRRPHAFLEEIERSDTGEWVSVATLFLTNRECPWRCLHCDLWKNTLTDSAPAGAIPDQIEFALAELERNPPSPDDSSRQIKLYNSGSFFDPHAIPVSDYDPIARRIAGFHRVIVESHPALVGNKTIRFQELLRHHTPVAGNAPALEVAMGLETAHPKVLARLNKRMTLDGFRRAADFLRENKISLRCFVLVNPPFLAPDESGEWARRSIDFAFDCGATVVSLIPTRLGNGALDALVQSGDFFSPTLSALESASEYGVAAGRGRVFADLWDLKRFSACAACFDTRRSRLHQMNLDQTIPPRIQCPCCDQTI